MVINRLKGQFKRLTCGLIQQFMTPMPFFFSHYYHMLNIEVIVGDGGAEVRLKIHPFTDIKDNKKSKPTVYNLLQHSTFNDDLNKDHKG